ncbi:extracellular solute-binding protein [Bacillus gobiensis]|uniref:extracellular solute-binding protein n=1 Tax=Bacillus gobiensis TaxID=1441095 RepID=UPI003D206B87
MLSEKKPFLYPKSIVILALIALLLSACSSEANNETGAEGSENKKVRMLTTVVGGKDDAEQKMFVEEIEKKTGLEVEMVKPPSDYDQKLLTSISSGEQYDLIYLTKNLMDVLVDQEALKQINEQIDGSKILSDKAVIPDEEWKQITYDDGAVYGVFNKLEGGTMPIIRQDWLKKLKLEQPKTLDEYYTILQAFTKQDPDGNGKDDTYGLSTAGLYDLQPFFSATGVKYKYVIDKDGKRTIPYSTEAAVPVFEWLNKLYKEGILDPNFVTNDTSKMRELFLTDRVGVVTYWDAWVGLFNNMAKKEKPDTSFEAKGITGAEGPKGFMLRRGDPSLFAIPANAQNVEGAMKFLEFWHSEEGNLLSTLGIEGHDYTVENDKYKLTDKGEEHGMDHGVVTPNNSHFKNPIGLLPGIEEAREVVMSNNSTLEISTGDWPEAEKIVTKYAFSAITGDMPAGDAVKTMHDELLSAGLIDQ